MTWRSKSEAAPRESGGSSGQQEPKDPLLLLAPSLPGGGTASAWHPSSAGHPPQPAGPPARDRGSAPSRAQPVSLPKTLLRAGHHQARQESGCRLKSRSGECQDTEGSHSSGPACPAWGKAAGPPHCPLPLRHVRKPSHGEVYSRSSGRCRSLQARGQFLCCVCRIPRARVLRCRPLHF